MKKIIIISIISIIVLASVTALIGYGVTNGYKPKESILDDKMIDGKFTWKQLDNNIVFYGAKKDNLISHYGTPDFIEGNDIFYDIPLMQPKGCRFKMVFSNDNLLEKANYCYPDGKGGYVFKEYSLENDPKIIEEESKKKDSEKVEEQRKADLKKNTTIDLDKVMKCKEAKNKKEIETILGEQHDIGIYGSSFVSMRYFLKDGSFVDFLLYPTYENPSLILCNHQDINNSTKQLFKTDFN